MLGFTEMELIVFVVSRFNCTESYSILFLYSFHISLSMVRVDDDVLKREALAESVQVSF